jgi:hypothetical protein
LARNRGDEGVVDRLSGKSGSEVSEIEYLCRNVKNEIIFYIVETMDKVFSMKRHHIEAWGLWWVQWQKQTKEQLQKNAMSPQSFVNTHLSVGSEGKGLGGNTTTSLVLLPK